jgi:hypothetical protein
MELKTIEAEIKAKFSLKKLHVSDRQNYVLFDFLTPEYLAYAQKTKPTRTYELVSVYYHKHMEPPSRSYPKE